MPIFKLFDSQKIIVRFYRFIGDNFYLVGGGQIRIYDMANDYKEVGRLEL